MNNIFINPNRIAKFEKVSFETFKTATNMDLFLPETEKAYENIKLPKRATKGSAGYDFYSPVDFSIDVGQTVIIHTGIRCRMNNIWVLICAPRSGHGFKYRAQLDNTIGIIDSDYFYSKNEGHIIFKLTNDGKAGKVLNVKAGEAIAQGIFLQYGITEDDDVQEIRDGGFGSTTK